MGEKDPMKKESMSKGCMKKDSMSKGGMPKDDTVQKH
jgi:pentapeptide MXKDX repeat protein